MGLAGSVGWVGGTMLAQEGGSGDLKPGSQAGQTRRIWWDLPEELVTLSLRHFSRRKELRVRRGREMEVAPREATGR